MLLRHPQGRRRPRYGAHLCCAAAAAFLLLLSISVLHSRLSSSSFSSRFLHVRSTPAANDSLVTLVDDEGNDALDGSVVDDRIDVLDVIEEADEAGEEETQGKDEVAKGDAGGYFWDHAIGARRRSFGGSRGRQDLWEDSLDDALERSRIAFASDDQPVDEEIRLKLASIQSIEDALLLKSGTNGGRSLLREGWAPWFEAKGRYLKQDRMFGSSVEPVNPANHPLLQDPDALGGLTGLTRGDRLLQKAMWKELERTPFLGGARQIKRVERKALGSEKKQAPVSVKNRVPTSNTVGAVRSKKEDQHIYADGRHWGYYPGLEQHSSFSEFMDRFLGGGRCSLKVFMVWNSPPWAYSVRHQRGLESLLHHHKDACVVMFSETMDLDFFRDFLKDGFRIAVVMPNLDELLKDTPVHVFASVWFEWRKTKHYPIHYSELIRLAALYKYGGIYLDSDVIVLKPISSVRNFIAIEGEMAGSPIFNGAVMAFEKESPVIMECLREFYSTYDDTRLRWNGAELLTRVNNGLGGVDKLHLQSDVKIEPSHLFFPIRDKDIARYFSAPLDDAERSEQDILLTKILNESITFHFWNGLTSALVPETGSLVEKLLNHHCLHCLDVL